MEQGRNTLLYLLLYGQLSYIHILLKFRLWLWPFRRRAFIWKATDLKRKKAFNQFKDLSRDCIFLCLLWHSWSIGDTSDYKWLLNNVKEEINYSIFSGVENEPEKPPGQRLNRINTYRAMIKSFHIKLCTRTGVEQGSFSRQGLVPSLPFSATDNEDLFAGLLLDDRQISFPAYAVSSNDLQFVLSVGEAAIFLRLGACVIINPGLAWGKDLETGLDRLRLWPEEMSRLENDSPLKTVVGESSVTHIGLETLLPISSLAPSLIPRLPSAWMFLFSSRVRLECVDLFSDSFLAVFLISAWWKASNEFDEFESGLLCVWAAW